MLAKLPVPDHFEPESVGRIRKINYERLVQDAVNWSHRHQVSPSSSDEFRICLVAVDVQNTFCIPDFELYVGGRSGTAAVDDNRRLCEFIYHNLHLITQIVPTLDTHQAMQIFHGLFFVDEEGKHPAPFTQISFEDIDSGKWRFNQSLSKSLKLSQIYMENHLHYYTRRLKESGKYDLTIWPYHAMLGGIGHALVPAVEEAIFFHTIARYSQPDFHMKGNHPLTEHYSILAPEVSVDEQGFRLVPANNDIFQKLVDFDAVIIAGQAKSHCVANTISDLLDIILQKDKELVRKVYLLEDCTSPVVIPEVIDYTDEANAAFKRFREHGMHVTRSTVPIAEWPGVMGKLLN